MYDICCIGHLTLDKVVTPGSVLNMAGGTAFYFSNALRNMPVAYVLVTSLAEGEMKFAEDLRRQGIEVNAFKSSGTVFFENIYSHNLDHRIQKVLQKADPFCLEQVQDIDASIFHLGPLLADDIPLHLIKTLAKKGRVSLDVQGYLRDVRDQQVYAIDWKDKREALPYVDILKASETEMEMLTGCNDVRKGAKTLSDWGVKEVVITLGSKGSVVYANGMYYDIPAYVPAVEADTTGCGDTYMAGYLYKRLQKAGIAEAGRFGAAMASLKIEAPGPFMGRPEEVTDLLVSVAG